jgi:hypothetical protein
MRWFGSDWGAPVCSEGQHVPTPVRSLCEGCQQPIRAGERGLVLTQYKPGPGPTMARDFPIHLACLMGQIYYEG